MSIRFDAVGDTLDRSSPPSNTAFTICGWARIVSNLGATVQPLAWALDAGNTDGYALHWDQSAGTMILAAYDAGALSSSATFASRPSVGQDFFFYLRCSGTSAGQFSGGWRAAGSATWDTQTATMAATIAAVSRIMFGGVLATYYGNKRLWNLKIWDRALSDAELDVESYYERVMFPANIHTHARMRNTTEVTDFSGNGRNLTAGGTLTTEDEYSLRRPSRRIFVYGATTTSLVVADAAHGHASDNVALTQANALALADALHAHAVDNVTLTQAHVLIVAESAHGHAADNLTLSQSVALAPADALHAHGAENAVLVQAHVLIVAEALHGHAADNVVVSVGITLSAAAALHAHQADGVTLAAAGTLAVAEALHAHGADALALTQAHALAVAEALHGHQADGVTLTPAGSLAVADAQHGHQADALALTQAHALAIQEALHGHGAEVVTLSQAVQLALADTLHAHGVEAPVLTQAHLLAIADALHAHLADGVTLAPAGTLVVSDALHAHLAALVGFSAPASRYTFRMSRTNANFVIH